MRAPRYDEYAYDDEVYEDEDEPVRVLTPARARSRRTRILSGLGGAIGLSFVLGLFPGLGVLWVVSLVSASSRSSATSRSCSTRPTPACTATTPSSALTPVARTVISPYTERASRYDDDEWEHDRIAAAR